MFGTVVTLLIFGLTLVLIMVRPWKVSEALVALVGAGLVLLLGQVGLDQAARLLADKWDVFLFFLGLMTIAAVADSAGFFDWTAALALKLAHGNGLRLFLNIFGLGAIISTFLSNDATALILTPVVYTLVSRLQLNPLPFMFACTFVADTASFVLPVSNPINILITQSFPGTQSLDMFLKHLLLPSLICIGLNAGLFVVIFRKQIPARFEAGEYESPKQVIETKGRAFFRYVTVCLGLIAVGYVLASLLHWPLSLVALAGGLALVGGAAFFRRLSFARLGHEISWSIFIFIGGMFILVQAIENIGLTREIGKLIVGAAGDSSFLAVILGTFGTALGTNFVNNVPMALVTNSALLQSGGDLAPAVHTGLVYSTIFGADLGPNLTTVGSLATVLWLLILRRKGLEVSPLQYFKLGLLVTPLMLLAGAIALWVTLLF